jgi:putative two-component system response regulator
MENFFEAAKVLIVDDEPVNVRLLERHLQKWGCKQIQSLTDSRQVLESFELFAPDIILLDLMMPYLNGLQVLEQLRPRIAEGSYLPILMLTADITPQAKQQGLAGGAKDFLTKPFDAGELLLRMSNLLETRFLNLHLETRVRERTSELEIAQGEILERLAQAAEFRDDDTGQHTQRVGALAAMVAREMGLAEEHVDLIRRAAPLHDVGKIGIPDCILLKPARLEPEEFAVMKSHTTIGARLLVQGHSDLVRLAEVIALTHHERWDGTGYPHGLQGESIPIEGRILSIVDVFDALTHERPYKKAWPFQAALDEIQVQSGRQFDPSVVQAFMRTASLPIHGTSTALEACLEEVEASPRHA